MSGITLLVEDPKWRTHRGLAARLTSAAEAARKAARLKGGFTILLAGDRNLRTLNHNFRGKDKPTNVLAFPAADASYLGDIALAHGVVKREAREQGKNFAHHAAHLALHGTLHLLGYDHESAGEARAMETLETALLERLEIADPYAPRLYTRPRKKA